MEGALIPEAWEELLPPNYPGRGELMDGIREGFKITDNPYQDRPVWQANYRSATDPTTRPLVEKQIKEEIRNGRYVRVQHPPQLISALGAIPKPGSNKVRLIHDCSRPHGGALNDLADLDRYSYQTLKDAAELIQPGDFLAKVDLESAYRSVKVHPSEYSLTGLAWTFEGEDSPTYLYDQRLPYGARKSPGHYNNITQAARVILGSLGHKKIVAYLDDFLVVGHTYQECQDSLNTLLRTLRYLGFSVNYSKLVGPTRTLTFLGVQIDTLAYTFALPPEKLRRLEEEAGGALTAKNVTKRKLQSLVGLLNWASQVIYGGRTHLRRIIDRINCLHSQHHRTRITEGIRADLIWWINNVRVFNGYTPISDPRVVTHVCIDACNQGAGGYISNDWYHLQWADWPSTEDLHINYKEVLALAPAVDLWGPLWQGQRVYVYSDNQAAVGILNRGTAKNPFVMSIMRRMWWLSVAHDFRIKAIYYPGCQNVIADAASRLHEPGGWNRLQSALQGRAGVQDYHGSGQVAVR